MKEIVENPSLFIALNKSKAISSVNKNVFLNANLQKCINGSTNRPNLWWNATGQNKLRGYRFYIPDYMNVVWIIKSGMSLTSHKVRNFLQFAPIL